MMRSAPVSSLEGSSGECHRWGFVRNQIPTSCPLGCWQPHVRPCFRNAASPLRQCEQCSMVFVYPSPSRAQIEGQYSCAYFQKKYQRLMDSGYVCPEFSRQKMMDCLLRATSLCRHLNGEPGTILDVGCGTGRFLELAQEKGWRTLGLELSEGIAENTAQRLGSQVYVGSILDVALPDHYVDAVTLFDVIEHLEDPVRALQVCHRALKPGGAIVLTTPNFNGLGRRLVGESAFGIWPDEHLLYFQPSTLRRALRAAGFDRIQLLTREVFVENASMFISRLRGRRETISRMPTGAEESVLGVKSMVRGNRLLRMTRSVVNDFFAHVLWGDDLVAFAVRP